MGGRGRPECGLGVKSGLGLISFLVPVLVVDVRIVLHQLLDDVQVARGRGEVQARALVVVGGVRVAAAREHQLHLVDVSALGELAQRARRRLFVVLEQPARLAQVVRDLAVALADGVGEAGAAPPG